MFSERTLFVVGAGASKEAGLPTGQELAAQISDLLNFRFEGYNELTRGDGVLARVLKEIANADGDDQNRVNDLFGAASDIRSAMPLAPSIDAFIESHEHNSDISLCGKLAIARSILAAEKNSLMYLDSSETNATLRFDTLGSTWFQDFFKILITGVPKTDLSKLFNNIAFIVFNYDRCIQQYLYHSIQSYFRIDSHAAGEVVSTLRILHPYGNIGDLRWQNRNAGVTFAESANPANLPSIASRIMTYSERVADESTTNEIKRLVLNANRIVFLGFAFHDQNMRLLKPASFNANAEVLATATGISKADCHSIEGDIRRTLVGRNGKGEIKIQSDLTCHDLFQNYQRSLMKS